MIVREEYATRADGVKLFRFYSDAGKYVVQNETGNFYSEAVDVENAPYTYSEGDDMEMDESTENIAELEKKAAAYDIITGVVE